MEDFAHAEFAATSLNTGGMVVRDAQAASNIGCGRDGSIAKRKDPVDVQATLRFEDSAGGGLGCFEVHGEGVVVPGIVESMAAVGNEEKLDAEFFRSGIEGAGLVAQFCGKEKDALAWLHRMVAKITSHFAIVRKTPALKPVCGKQGLNYSSLQERFGLTDSFPRFGDRDQLVPRRLRSTIPRLVEKGHGCA